MADDKKLKPTEVLHHIVQLFAFLKKMEVVPVFFVLSILCSFLAVFFSFLGVQLLIPFITGVVQGNFMSVRDQFGIIAWLTLHSGTVFNSSNAFFLLLVGITLGSVVVKSFFEYIGTLCVNYQEFTADKNIRKLIFERYLTFGKMYYDRVGIGRVHNVLTNATYSVSGQLSMFQRLISQLVTLAVYLGIMFWISWRLTILTLVILPLTTLTTRKFSDWMRRTSRRYEGARINVHQRTFNLISCIPLVKAYAAEDAEKQLFSKASDEELSLRFEMQKKDLMVPPIQDFNSMIALLFIACLMAWWTPVAHAAKGSSYIVFFFVLRWAIPIFSDLNGFMYQLARIDGALEQVRDALSDQEKHIVPNGPAEFKGLVREIRLKNLNFSYRPEVPVLRGVDFAVPKGRMTAIVGPTGAGKTTIFNLLLRFYDCPSGTIFFDDTDIRDLNIKSLMDHIGIVSQDTLLFNESLRFNLSYGLSRTVSDDELMEAAKKARLNLFINRLPKKLDTIIGERGVKLSGGERQRTAIARVFLKEADILLLDEATSALDTQTERLIQEAIDCAIKDRTAIVIAHRLSTIANADQIIVLDNGVIAERGTLKELMEKKGKFYQYWEAQKIHLKNTPEIEISK